METKKAQEILDWCAQFEPRLIEIRRWLHQHPELGHEEYVTSERIIRELELIPGMEIVQNLGKGTGVMGILRGVKPGKTILLRADMDALPIDEKSDCEYCSLHEGKMHACGHDVHVTWLLGAAMILSQLRSSFHGVIKFLFQPAEEIAGGHYVLEDKRVLSEPEVSYVFAAHAWPSIEVGKIGIAETYAFGAIKNFTLEIHGKGGHGSWPHKTIDPIAIGNVVYGALQQIVSRQINPIEPRVISIGSMHAGPLDKGNIIPDTCTMIGTMRATNSDILAQMEHSMRDLVENITQGFHARAQLTFDEGLAPVKNDPALVQTVCDSASKILGNANVFIMKEPNLGGEDFSCFTEKKPGVYFFVGSSHPSLLESNALHNASVVFDEKAIFYGAQTFAMLSLDVLGVEGEESV